VGASRGPTLEFGKMLIMTLTARVRRPSRGIGFIASYVAAAIYKMVQPINYVIKIKKIFVVII
jgi:hypothetical protein